MQKVLGAFIIIGCVLGGYAMANGDMRVLWQPAEVVITLDAALGTRSRECSPTSVVARSFSASC